MINLKNLQGFIAQIAENKKLEEDMVRQALAEALAIAYKKDYASKEDKVIARINEKSGKVSFYLIKQVVDPNDVESGSIKFNPHRHILLDEAKKIKNDLKPGDEIEIELPYQENFSRIAAQTAKQVIMQRLREIEKNVIYDEFKGKEGSVVTGTIQKIDTRAIYVDLIKTTGIMFKTETIPNEIYRVQSRMRFYVYAVENTPRGVEVYLSRAHPLFIPAIFKVEVPEISEGIIEIKGVARIPGVRTKLAVSSNVEGVDAVGACIGPRGSRIITIMNELNNEKIDIIPWSEDPIKYVINALLPGRAVSAEMLPKRTVRVFVSEDQVPIILGKNGQNIKLASRLTGWKIEVRLAEKPEEIIEGGIADETEVEEEKETI